MQGRESKNIRRAFTHCLAPRSCDGMVYVRKRKQAMEVTAAFKNIKYAEIKMVLK